MYENCSWVTVKLNDSDVNISEKCSENLVLVLDYPSECDQTNCYPYILNLSNGTYSFKLYGAQGGSLSDIGGKGGFVSGILSIALPSTFYAYIGAKGVNAVGTKTKNAYNGGGYGYGYGTSHNIASGGGGTDIRTIEDDLNSRIIVAGGGGGSSYHSQSDVRAYFYGGDGGGLFGTDASPGKHLLEQKALHKKAQV